MGLDSVMSKIPIGDNLTSVILSFSSSAWKLEKSLYIWTIGIVNTYSEWPPLSPVNLMVNSAIWALLQTSPLKTEP